VEEEIFHHLLAFILPLLFAFMVTNFIVTILAEKYSIATKSNSERDRKELRVLGRLTVGAQ
jgi:hypothetical protein